MQSELVTIKTVEVYVFLFTVIQPILLKDWPSSTLTMSSVKYGIKKERSESLADTSDITATVSI